MQFLIEGWQNFNAEWNENNDGNEYCVATLKVQYTGSPPDPRGGNAVSHYEGSTGKEHGHAEMDALHKFVCAIRRDPNTFEDYDATIICRNKACCRSCSAILGFLDIKAGRGTFKSPQRSNNDSLTPTLREFILDFLVYKGKRNATMEKLQEFLDTFSNLKIGDAKSRLGLGRKRKKPESRE